jgi:hypothetical protein
LLCNCHVLIRSKAVAIAIAMRGPASDTGSH